MPNRAAAGCASAEAISRRQHPHPDEGIPRFAWPTLVLAIGALTVFVLVVAGVLRGHLPSWAAILAGTTVTYVMYAVAHEALHYSVSSIRWVNTVVGRLAWIFVVPPFSLPAFGYVHMQHHRYTNGVDKDPDMFATHGPAWQLPLRRALMDVCYATWYTRRLRSRFRQASHHPAAEPVETAMVFSLSAVGLDAAVRTGHLWTLAVLVVIPQRIGIILLAWSFDWLPHHGLDETQRTNRYRATRLRAGREWLLAPLVLAQNYHLVHHLHPWLLFYRYLPAWRRN